MNNALAALEAQVRADLAKTAHPGAAWLAPKPGPDGRPALDVLVVGAGQSGLAAAFGLLRSQVNNILVLDKSEAGREGPWLTYARMHTLRSPKDFTGPDLDIPSLTYQSWHEARFGDDDWRKLDLIPRELWAEYLLWFRRVVGLPVRNGCAQDCTGDGAGRDGRLDHSRAAAPSAVFALRAYGAAGRLHDLAR
jgi:FAD-dependent urate hydroxylase